VSLGKALNGIASTFEWLDWLGLGTHLFVNVPRPRDSEGTFWSSSQAVKFACCDFGKGTCHKFQLF